MQKILIFIGLFILSHVNLIAQTPASGAPPTDSLPAINAVQDTSKQETPASVPAGNAQTAAPRNYNSIIKPNAISRRGLFTVHIVNDEYFFEIPDSLLGRDLLVVTRIAQGAAGVRQGYAGYAGDQVGHRVIRFEKGPANKLFLRRITYEENPGDSSNAMFNAVIRSNLQPLVAAFGISAYSPNNRGSLVNVTDYLNGDNDVFFFNRSSKQGMKIGRLESNMSYIKDINAYPLNLELRTIKTYTETVNDNTLTMELNTSILLLPKKPMRKRFADRRVGYFTERYVDYDANPQGVKVVSYIKRWRLEPKPEDVERYRNGELVEPQKPIVYYIDPATPKKWIPYLIQGVEDWQVAFERAGFKNAIIAKRAPTQEEDPNWSLEDSRHSAIVYKPSSIANASGPVITDPRSGEILESHINWYHNLMSILREWYMIQCGPNDIRAQRMRFDDELMGQLIRSVASHEVGHSLGLLHNFGASSTVPVEKLRDRNWVEVHGHTPSIMDYSRFNYVAQPEDSIGHRGLISRIGEYDLWAIEFGYRWYPDIKTPEGEIAVLNRQIIEKSENTRLWFGSEFASDDPRAQTEDLGDNAMLASEYGIKNLKRVIPNLIQWTYVPNEGYRNLAAMYRGAISQFDNYMGHVMSNIGGMYETSKSVEQAGAIYEPVPAERQVEALNFLARHIFQTPQWLLDTAILTRVGLQPTEIIRTSQEKVVNHLLNTSTLAKLANAEALYGAKAYPVMKYLADVDNAIWGEIKTGDTLSVYTRNLQRYYIEKLIDLSSPSRSAREYRDVAPLIVFKLDEIRERIRRTLPKLQEPMSVYHLRYLQARIDPVVKQYRQ